ncbi:MAG TPA: hypothetical protein VK874_00235 [Gaiellaceae bacterium]|nr:hypothetical protein [Gaiellaceae bacterium]
MSVHPLAALAMTSVLLDEERQPVPAPEPPGRRSRVARVLRRRPRALTAPTAAAAER